MNASTSSPHLLELDSSSREELVGEPEGVKVRLDRAASPVLCSQVQVEGANQVGYAGSAITGPEHEEESSQVLLNRCAEDWRDSWERNSQVRA
jgi:hypothetical protein